MTGLKLTPRARADLDGIWEYSAREFGIEQAEAYLTSLGATMNMLAAHPRLGANIDTIKQGYRKFPAASHLIVFRETSGAIEVVRILHKSMDVERHV